MTNPTNSKAGTQLDTDGAPALPTEGGEVFGTSPLPGRPTSETPTNTLKGVVPDSKLSGHSNE